MKKSTFGLLAASALIFTPVAAFAQDAQNNLQINRTAGAAAGYGNVVNQTTDQTSFQDQYDINGYGYGTPSVQSSIQDNANTASAVGEYNFVNQNDAQYNGQSNTSVDPYGAYYQGY